MHGSVATRPRDGSALARALTDPIANDAYRDDPQLIVNLVHALPKVHSLSLTVGPLCAPEHVDHNDLLDRPAWQSHIQQLAFRFNPYVSERSYYTFLKVSREDLGC